jgi:hypothetical protein
MFNQMYSSLRRMNPAYARDPLVAGTYMRQMLDSPLSAGGLLTQTVSTRDKFPGLMQPAVETAQRTMGKTMERGPEDKEMQELQKEKLKHEMREDPLLGLRKRELEHKVSPLALEVQNLRWQREKQEELGNLALAGRQQRLFP